MKKILITALYLVLAATPALAETKTEAAIAARVELLRLAMINADSEQLRSLTSSQLNYGHSGGHVENQQDFIEKIVSGKSDFVTMELRDQQIQVNQDVAIVRHRLVATTNDSGKPGEVDIGVMQVWQKQHGQWKLLARQAFKTH